MADPETLVISCAIPERIVGAMNAVMPQLTPDFRKRFNKLKLRYLQLYGIDGLYARVNNRTVARILAEYDGGESTPLESGQIGDVRYELYDAPDERKEPDEPSAES